jgi:hypothetical protein
MNALRPSSLPFANARLALSYGEIATRAYALWQQERCPQGCDQEIWLKAERQLWSELRLEKAERDRIALADRRFAFNRGKVDLMGELDRRFPTGKATTSL